MPNIINDSSFNYSYGLKMADSFLTNSLLLPPIPIYINAIASKKFSYGESINQIFFRKIWTSGQNDEMRKFGQVQPYTNQNMYKYVVPPGHYEISCR